MFTEVEAVVPELQMAAIGNLGARARPSRARFSVLAS